MSLPRKELKRLRDYLKPYGFQVVPGRKHYKVVNPDGRTVTTLSCSPSDDHAVENTIKHLHRYNHIP